MIYGRQIDIFCALSRNLSSKSRLRKCTLSFCLSTRGQASGSEKLLIGSFHSFSFGATTNATTTATSTTTTTVAITNITTTTTITTAGAAAAAVVVPLAIGRFQPVLVACLFHWANKSIGLWVFKCARGK